jgi:ABC-type transport system substrate-binding protein
MQNLMIGITRLASRRQRAGWMRSALIGVCAAILTFSGHGCRGSTSGTTAPAALQIGVGLPREGGPVFGVPSFVSLLTNEPLVGVGRDGRPTQRVAAEWSRHDGGRRIRLRIHPNLYFHDDSKLTAGQVRELLLKQSRNPLAPLSFSSITSIQVVKDDEIDIYLSQPEAFLITDLITVSVTHPMNPKLGTGPYRVPGGSSEAVATQKEYAKLEAFPAYYRGRPRTESVEVKAYATQRTAWAALMRREINALHEVSPGAMEFVEKESSVRTYTFLRGYYSFLGFNMSHPVLARREVRQALSQAINREEIVQRALKGRGQPADGPVWPFHWAYSTAQRGYTYNPEAARLRLDAAGFPLPTKGWGRMPSRLRFSCLIVDDPRWEQTALLVQKQLFDIGVDMEVEAKPLVEFAKRLAAGNFETILGEYTSARSLAWVYYAWHSSHLVHYSPKTGYKAADAVLDRLRHATTDQDIRGYVGELQRTLFEDPPAIFIAWPYSSRAVSTLFSVPHERDTDIIGNIWQWQSQTPAQVARR